MQQYRDLVPVRGDGAELAAQSHFLLVGSLERSHQAPEALECGPRWTVMVRGGLSLCRRLVISLNARTLVGCWQVF